jgi:hypothetical protein
MHSRRGNLIKCIAMIWILASGIMDTRAGKMLISDRGASRIQIADLDGSNLRTLIPSAGTNVRGIAIDVKRNLLFYADNGGNVIYQAKLDGSDREPIVSTGLRFPADLALDKKSSKIYWCDRDNDRIERSDYDGGNRETVIETESPYYLDLDLTHEKLYWGDFSGGNIFRASLPNAENTEKIVSGLIRTRGVKVDPKGGYFYWCDRETHKIQRKPINGGDIEDLYTSLDTPHGMTLDINAKKVYWVDTGTNSIEGTGAKAVSRGDMDGSGKQEVLASLSQPWDLTLDTRVTNYGEWTKRRFRKDAPPTLISPESDPDNDQNNNLLEYFSGTNPFVFGKKEILSLIRSSPYIELSYRMTNQPIEDIRVNIEGSENLLDWVINPQDIEELDASLGEESALINQRFNYQAREKRGRQIRLKISLINP